MNSTASAGGIRGSIAARLDRLPLTGYQKKLFAIIATAWFFDSMDLGAMTFILGSIKAEFGLSPAQAGLLASSSFFGMFLGAAIAGMLADKSCPIAMRICRSALATVMSIPVCHCQCWSTRCV